MQLTKSLRSNLAILLVVGATALVLLAMLQIEFINDDIDNIRFAIKGDNPDIGALFTTDEIMVVYYRPVVSASLMLDFVIWGWSAYGYRFTNLLLHLANVLLVYHLGRKLFEKESVALISAALFGVHPIHELSLFWIPGRTDVLCSLFFLASIMSFIRYWDRRQRRYLAGSMVFYLLSILSKEMGMSLPLLIPVLVWWLSGKKGRRATTGMILRYVAPFALTTAALLLVRWIWFGNDPLFGGNQEMHEFISLPRLAKNLASYLGLLLIPAGHESIEQILSAQPALFLVLSIGVGILSLVLLRYSWRHDRNFLFAVLFILITIVPVIRLMMRWYLYIPSIGFSLGAAVVIDRFACSHVKRLVAICSVLWLTYASILFSTSLDWVSTSSLGMELLKDVKSQLGDLSAQDTITFASVPGKIGSTPLMNLGVRRAVHHALERDDIEVVVWSKVNIKRYPSKIHWKELPETISVELTTEGEDYFTLDYDPLKNKRLMPSEGLRLMIEEVEVTIETVNSAQKPASIICTPSRFVGKNLFLFNGSKFIMIK